MARSARNVVTGCLTVCGRKLALHRKMRAALHDNAGMATVKRRGQNHQRRKEQRKPPRPAAHQRRLQ